MTPYYKTQLERGLIYQDFVYEILHRFGITTVAYSSKLFQIRQGENKAGIEIKFDDKRKTTGNLWIETHEKTNPANLEYIPSGINRDCVEYVIGDYDIIYRFSTVTLRLFRDSGKYKEMENNLKTSKGFLLSESMGSKWATATYRVDCEAQVSELIQADKINSRNAAREMAQLLIIMKCDPRQASLFDNG